MKAILILENETMLTWKTDTEFSAKTKAYKIVQSNKIDAILYLNGHMEDRYTYTPPVPLPTAQNSIDGNFTRWQWQRLSVDEQLEYINCWSSVYNLHPTIIRKMINNVI